MALTKPESVDECIYFTNRTIDNGKVMAWVFKVKCQKCGKGIMGKPIKKNGKIDKKANRYEGPECKYFEEEQIHEEKLLLNIDYVCPYCGNKDEITTEYKRKKFQGVPSYVFECQKCGKTIPITKKLKSIKSKDKDNSLAE